MLNQSNLLQFSFLGGKWAGKSHRIGEIYDEMFGTLIVIFLSVHRFAQSTDIQRHNKTLSPVFIQFTEGNVLNTPLLRFTVVSFSGKLIFNGVPGHWYASIKIAIFRTLRRVNTT